jgi:hypothetical protein
MNSNRDPFLVVVYFLIIFSIVMLVILSTSERQDQDNKAEIIKEAIQKGWTPEQVKIVIEKF